ncbi:S1/P1 nuclease [Alteromonas ponticola]|nr:S1/P1 nuclease [Alteromonas sp. ASW11-130]MCW8091059.1 S1/P1 nuclease [Alteromonas sp. ASW11-130]
MAWGQTGHRVTGAIAEHYLSNEAKSAVEALLPNESLAEASTWADEMRSNPDEFWQRTATPWHYVTIPGDKTYQQTGAPKQGDAFTALQYFRQLLTSPTSSAREKQKALRFIVHIIGDLHQPLHAGNGNDKGGNDIKVRFFWNDSNLHRVWDSQMLEQRKLSYTEWTEWLLQKISDTDRDQWRDTNPQTWIDESVAIRKTIYPKDANNMNYDYLYEHIPTVKKRLQQAGVRIAAYLNEVFK